MVDLPINRTEWCYQDYTRRPMILAPTLPFRQHWWPTCLWTYWLIYSPRRVAGNSSILMLRLGNFFRHSLSTILVIHNFKTSMNVQGAVCMVNFPRCIVLILLPAAYHPCPCYISLDPPHIKRVLYCSNLNLASKSVELCQMYGLLGEY